MYAWTSLGNVPAQVPTGLGRFNYDPQLFEPLAFHDVRPISASQVPNSASAQNAHQSLPSRRSPQDDYPSDESSDPNGHDLGFLSLLYESPPHTHEDGTSSNGGRGQGEVPSAGAGYHGTAASSHQTLFRGRNLPKGSEDAGNDESFEGLEGSKRRRGRPVGSKDRQPRVKRMATSPQPSSEHSQRSSQREGENGRRKPWKIILTAEQAVEIYSKRTLATDSQATSSCRSNEVAEQYGVNSKTIRDIWNRATWVKATRPQWTSDEEELYANAQLNRRGASPNGATSEHATGPSNRCSEEGDSASSRHAFMSSLAEKRTRGRPRGARDMRPRTTKRKPGPDERPHSEGAGASQGAGAAEGASMLGKVFNMVSNASASQPLDLQRLLAQPAAAMDHDKMTMACHQRQRNSSSNTSHSQTSSYTNDDSHSGDQGSDSGGSGADHSPLQDQAPRSPGRAGSNRHMPSTAMGLGVPGWMPMGDMPTLQAFNRYAHAQGLRPTDSALQLHPHAGTTGGEQPGALANQQVLAHMQTHLANPRMHAPALQDQNPYQAQHYSGGDGAHCHWGKQHLLAAVEHHGLPLPHHQLGLHDHRTHPHAIPTRLASPQGVAADASALELQGAVPPSRRSFGGDAGGGENHHQMIELAGNDGLHTLGVFGGWPPLPRVDIRRG